MYSRCIEDGGLGGAKMFLNGETLKLIELLHGDRDEAVGRIGSESLEGFEGEFGERVVFMEVECFRGYFMLEKEARYMNAVVEYHLGCFAWLG